MNKRHMEECGSIWLWIRVWASALREYKWFGGCWVKKPLGFEWGENKRNTRMIEEGGKRTSAGQIHIA